MSAKNVTVNFDVDGVGVDSKSGLIDRVNDDTNRFEEAELCPGDFSEWNFQVPGVDDGIGTVINHFLRNDPSYIESMDPIPGSISTIRWLYNQPDVDVQIVTHRPPETHKYTKAWLADHEVPYDRFVEEVPQNKAEVCGDVLIDDKPENAYNMVLDDRVGILFVRPYNYHRLSEIPGVLSVYDVDPDFSVDELFPDVEFQWKAIQWLLCNEFECISPPVEPTPA